MAMDTIYTDFSQSPGRSLIRTTMQVPHHPDSNVSASQPYNNSDFVLDTSIPQSMAPILPFEQLSISSGPVAYTGGSNGVELAAAQSDMTVMTGEGGEEYDDYDEYFDELDGQQQQEEEGETAHLFGAITQAVSDHSRGSVT